MLVGLKLILLLLWGLAVSEPLKYLSVATMTIPLTKRYRPTSSISNSAHLQRFPDFVEQTGTITSASQSNQTFHWLIKEMAAPNGLQFVGEVYFGHNLSSFFMIFDSGSNYPWIVHKDSHLMQDPAFDRKGFACRDSPTCKINYEHMDSAMFGFQYGKGETQGVICTDSFGLSKSLVVNDSQMMLAIKGKDLEGLLADGLMGVGYRPGIPAGLTDRDLDISLKFNRDYFGQLQNLGLVKDLVFGFNIEEDVMNTGRISTFSLGGIDSTVVEDDNRIDQHPVSTDNRWTVYVEKLVANGADIIDGGNMLVDSGTSILIIRPDQMEGYLNVISKIEGEFNCMYSQEMDTFGCIFADIEDVDKIPSLILHIGNSSYEILPIHLLQSCQRFTLPDLGEGIACSFRLASSPDLHILGIPFFLGHYIVLDRDNGYIGIYKKTVTEDTAAMANEVMAKLINPYAWHEKQPGPRCYDYILLTVELTLAIAGFAMVYRYLRRQLIAKAA